MTAYKLPLSGLRVLDLTMAWAGPYGTHLLADMGAEVIKIESPRNWDVIRALHLLPEGTERPYDKSGFFNHLNRNKLSLALDLSLPAGRDVFLRLVSLSDAVIENYRADVMEGFGLTYEALRQARPDIVYVTMPGHGLEGPESHYLAYGTHVEQMSGLAWLTGYRDGGPQKCGISYGDPVAGIFAAAAVCLGLYHRRLTGRGQRIELAQREALISLLGEFYVGRSMTGEDPPRRGNRHPSMAPHGCYPCREPDSWLTIAVGSDAEFATLCDVIARPDLAPDERYADVVSRHQNQDDLDEVLTAWTRELDAAEAAARLQAAGVAAAPVIDIPRLMTDPHLLERAFFTPVAHALAGVWEMDTPVWRLSLTPAHVRLNGPSFGEHNEYVLRELLGLSEAEVAALEREGVVAREPDVATHA